MSSIVGASQGAVATAERLAAATAEMAPGAEQAQAAVEMMDNATKDVAGMASDCAAAAAAGLRDAEQIRENASGAQVACQDVVDRATALRSMISVMVGDVTDLVDWVNTSVETSQKSARLIKGLQASSAEVGTIGETVVDIADQTNLLAFNAAIEEDLSQFFLTARRFQKGSRVDCVRVFASPIGSDQPHPLLFGPGLSYATELGGLSRRRQMIFSDPRPTGA